MSNTLSLTLPPQGGGDYKVTLWQDHRESTFIELGYLTPKNLFWGAVDSLKWAIKLEPKRAKYWSYLSLSYTKIPNSLKDAEEALVEAIKFDPYNAEHYVNLGLIYIKAGMKKRAYNQFEKSLKFDPENVKAKKGLDQTKG